MIRPTSRGIACSEAAILLAVLANIASAVPYASGVRNTSGTTWEFILNEAADNVTVTRDGGNPLNLGGLAAGHAARRAGGSGDTAQVELEEHGVRLDAGDDEAHVVRQPGIAPRAG